MAFASPESWLGDKTRLAFSILTRQEAVQLTNQRFVGNEPVGGGRFGLETLSDQRMRETWGGLTLSRRIGDRWGLGATLYGVYRGQRTRFEQNLQLAYPGGDGVAALVVNDFDYGHWRVLGKVGLAWEGDAFRLGASGDDAGRGSVRQRQRRLHAVGDRGRHERGRQAGQPPR